MILSIPFFEMNNTTRRKMRKFITSSYGKELDQEFEIIIFGDRSKLINWVYNNYLQIIENENEYKSNYDISWVMPIRFVGMLKVKAAEYYKHSMYMGLYDYYIPYYYDTVIVPILKRFHKQKAFL